MDHTGNKDFCVLSCEPGVFQIKSTRPLYNIFGHRTKMSFCSELILTADLHLCVQCSNPCYVGCFIYRQKLVTLARTHCRQTYTLPSTLSLSCMYYIGCVQQSSQCDLYTSLSCHLSVLLSHNCHWYKSKIYDSTPT